MTEIKLTKRYPHSRTEDITDAFMRGYEQGKKDGLKVGKQIVLGAFETYITADRKTENSSEKPNNCEPQTERPCNKCEWYQKYGKCVFGYCHYEYEQAHKTEPQRGCDADCTEDCIECAKETELWKAEQTETEIVLDPSFAELSDEQFVEAMKLIEPQTDCSWK